MRKLAQFSVISRKDFWPQKAWGKTHLTTGCGVFFGGSQSKWK